MSLRPMDRPPVRNDMTTPIADLIRAYIESSPVRLHMPGHKGHGPLGCEPWDITEIPAADELYAPTGIIRESEDNASALFGSGRTLYSTEGSSQCIRAMVHLAAVYARTRQIGVERAYILAARNAHKTFLYALALTDLDVKWMMPATSGSLCSCPLTAADVEEALHHAPTPPAAVYLTSPDYLGHLLPIREIAEVCHAAGVPLLVDNAHGAYLHFLKEDLHPLTAGADMCCDSAHKTLPALTGAAYLHISKNAPAELATGAREAMALFGSTSPSYLILASLDLCNATLAERFRKELAERVQQLEEIRWTLRQHGWTIEPSEPMKLTLRTPTDLPGDRLAEQLRRAGYVCEYADREHIVMMPSVGTTDRELDELVDALGNCPSPPPPPFSCHLPVAEQAMTVREAICAPFEVLPCADAVGRICATPTVSCPPAIPIVVSGEIIRQEHIRLLEHYGIKEIAVVRKSF